MSGRLVILRMADAIRHHDASAYARLFAERGVLEDPLFPEPVHSPHEIRQAEEMLLAPFDDLDPRIVHVAETGRTAVAEVVLTARHTKPVDVGLGDPLPPSGERVELPMVWVMELDDQDRILCERDYFDTGLLLWHLSHGT